MINSALTDTDGCFSRPAVILLTYAYWNTNESEPRVTLVDHTAPVIIVLTNYLPIYYGVWRATVSRWGDKQVHKRRGDTDSQTIQQHNLVFKYENCSVIKHRCLTKTLDLRSTPQAIGHTFSHPGAYQSIACVTGENGCCSKYS